MIVNDTDNINASLQSREEQANEILRRAFPVSNDKDFPHHVKPIDTSMDVQIETIPIFLERSQGRTAREQVRYRLAHLLSALVELSPIRQYDKSQGLISIFTSRRYLGKTIVAAADEHDLATSTIVEQPDQVLELPSN